MQYRESTTSTTRQLIAYGEEYFPLGHTDYGKTVDKITSSGAEVVFNTIVPPGLTPFLERPIAVTSTAAFIGFNVRFRLCPTGGMGSIAALNGRFWPGAVALSGTE
jgi:hypothetical protein